MMLLMVEGEPSAKGRRALLLTIRVRGYCDRLVIDIIGILIANY